MSEFRVVFRLWPASPSANAAGMAAAWLLSAAWIFAASACKLFGVKVD